MDKTLVGLFGAVSLLAAADSAQAAMPAAPDLSAAMRTDSYADLLKPIPNATTLLKASDEAASRAGLIPAASDGDAVIEQVQYYYHHHHHHRFYRRFYHHHHHHRFFRRFHHHHHHHHRFFRRDYY